MKARIVVGVDGSPAARVALEWAIRLGGALDAEVVAVHAVGLLEGSHEPDVSFDAWRVGVRDVVEHQWCAPLAGSSVEHRIEVVDGDAVDALLRAAGHEQAAMVVVGARGISDRPELALGSTSLRVLQAEQCLTLVVPASPPPGPAGGALRHILVGVDRSPASLAALTVASEIAGTLGGSLSVLEAFGFDPLFPLGRSAVDTSRGDEHALETTAALLEDLVRGIRGRGTAVQVIVRSGEPVATLLNVAGDIDADLLVLGSRGRGDPADPLLGSVARTVAARARRATLVVPAAGGAARVAPEVAHQGRTR